MARFDIDIDHRIVSVVQIEDDTAAEANDASPVEPPTSAPTPPVPGQAAASAAPTPAAGAAPAVGPAVEVGESPRPSIVAISVRTSGAEAVAEVVLGFEGQTFHGTATSHAAAQHRPRLVAQATLSALAPLLGLPIDVDSAAVVDAGGSEVALVVLTATAPRMGPQSLSGSAVLRGDEADAVARAVLDAVNRRLTG
jgi:hypothetical protein